MPEVSVEPTSYVMSAGRCGHPITPNRDLDDVTGAGGRGHMDFVWCRRTWRAAPDEMKAIGVATRLEVSKGGSISLAHEVPRIIHQHPVTIECQADGCDRGLRMGSAASALERVNHDPCQHSASVPRRFTGLEPKEIDDPSVSAIECTSDLQSWHPNPFLWPPEFCERSPRWTWGCARSECACRT